MIKKTLVFYWYASRMYKNDITYPFHLACIKKYSYAFDNAIFVISVDDINDKDLVFETENGIICSIGGIIGNIKFDVILNDNLCEVNAFEKYILKNGSSESMELFFFAHTKGARIIHSYPDYKEDYLRWIFSLYFYCLEKDFLYEMQLKLVGGFGGNLPAFFGPIGFINEDKRVFYPGTFYWVNMNTIYNDEIEGTVSIPKISNRAFCEKFPLIYSDAYKKLSSHNNKFKEPDESWYLYNHCNWDEISEYFGEKERFFNEYNKIKESIGL